MVFSILLLSSKRQIDGVTNICLIKINGITRTMEWVMEFHTQTVGEIQRATRMLHLEMNGSIPKVIEMDMVLIITAADLKSSETLSAETTKMIERDKEEDIILTVVHIVIGTATTMEIQLMKDT